MHKIAPNCVSNFKIFLWVTPPHPIPGGHLLPARRFAPRLVAESIIPLTLSYCPERNGWISPASWLFAYRRRSAVGRLGLVDIHLLFNRCISIYNKTNIPYL